MQTDDHFYDPNNQHERMTGTSYRAWPKRLDQIESPDPLASGLWSRLTPREEPLPPHAANASLIVQRLEDSSAEFLLDR